MIKEFVLDNSINIIKKKYDLLNEEEIEIIRYGLEGIYLTMTKLIIIIFIAVKLNILYNVLIFLLFFNIIRTFSFGLHAKNSIKCLLSSTTIFIGIPILCKIIEMNFIIKLVLFITSTLIISIYSPADTEKRPIVSKKRRLFYKTISTFICIIYMIVGLTINNTFISNLIVFALIVQALIVNPLSYKVFNMPYNNYKNFKK